MIKGAFSENGSFHACYIKKLGRAEIQIHPIVKSELDHSLALTFPVTSNSEVVHLEWFSIDSDASTKEAKVSRKRKNDSSAPGSSKSGSESELVYLAVFLRNGSILVYSPFKRELVNEFQTNSSVVSCCFANNTKLRNAVWILHSNEIVLVELSNFRTLNKINVAAKNVKNLSSVKELKINGNDYLFITSEDAFTLIDINSKAVSNTIHVDTSTDKVRSIISCKDSQLIVCNTHSVYIVSLPEFKLANTIPYASSAIQSLFPTKAESFGVILQDLKVEIFSNILKKPTTKTIAFENSLNGVILNSLYQDQESQVFVSLYDYELRLERVQARELKKAKHVIDFSSQETDSKVSNSSKTQRLSINAPRELTAVEELSVSNDADLIQLLASVTEDSFKLLQVLVSNTTRAKSIVAQLPEDLAQKSFKIIAFRLEQYPTESTSLNEWLKWLLISHKSITANPANRLNLKNLKRELTKSTKSLPTFLGLQGRLELLKSQLQLRMQVSSLAAEEGEEEEEEEADEFSLLGKKNQSSNSNGNGNSNGQSEIVYVNGENDENDEEVVVTNGIQQGSENVNVDDALNNLAEADASASTEEERDQEDEEF